MIPLDVIENILAFNDQFDALNFLSIYDIDTDYSDSTYINLSDTRTKNVFNEIDPHTIIPVKCQWIENKMNNLTLPEVFYLIKNNFYFIFLKILCNKKCETVNLYEPVNSFDINDCYNLDPFNPYKPNYSTITQNDNSLLKKTNNDLVFDKKLTIPISTQKTNQFFVSKKRQRRRSASQEPPFKSIALKSIEDPIESSIDLNSNNTTNSLLFSQPVVDLTADQTTGLFFNK